MIRTLFLASLVTSACLALGCAPAAAPLPPAGAAGTSAPLPASAASSSSGARPRMLGAEASAFTFERIARSPAPGMQIPRALSFSPDGKTVTFLQSEQGDQRMSLFAFDLTTHQTSVLLRAADLGASAKKSREEELRDERQRKRLEGITGYSWARRANVLLVPHQGDVYLRRENGGITRLTSTPEPELDPKLCADAARVAYVRGRELLVMDVKTQRETALTRGAPEGITRGQSDYNGQEEFDEPSGFFWSPGCDRIAYLEVDEREVAKVAIAGFREGRSDVDFPRYPRAGQKNPRVRAGIVDVATQKTTWVTFAHDEERYLTRLRFAPDGKSLWLQAISRDQKRLTLARADVSTGRVTEVVNETSATWIDPADMLPLEKSSRFLWTGDRGGHNHLQLRDAASGAVLQQLTEGPWEVSDLVGVDEAQGTALALTSRAGPLQQSLDEIPLSGGEPRRVTPERGTHHAVLAEGSSAGAFVDLSSAIDRAPQVTVRQVSDAAELGRLPVGQDDLTGIRAPELVSLVGPSGDTLFGTLLKPRTMTPGVRYPAVVMVYGGPGVREVSDRWNPRLLWQHLADRGVVVFELDNRGSAGRGHAFADPLYRKLGTVELEDQVAGARWLAAQPFVDGQRLGIYGHSYGGFLSALAMLAAPAVFEVGIAGSPVTDFALYDTGYTERFLGTPQDNPAGYAHTDLTKLAGNLTGNLLLLHGMMDENVHFANTAALVDALVAKDKRFDLMVFPGERHGYRNAEVRKFVPHLVVDYLEAHL